MLLDCGVGEDSWESLIQPVHPKGNQSWIFIGRTDVEAEAPVLWPPDGKSWLIWKDPDAGKDWRQEEKGTTEDETAERHHQLNGREFELALGVGDGQGGLACCSPWGVTKSRTRLSDLTELMPYIYKLCYILCINTHSTNICISQGPLLTIIPWLLLLYLWYSLYFLLLFVLLEAFLVYLWFWNIHSNFFFPR